MPMIVLSMGGGAPVYSQIVDVIVGFKPLSCFGVPIKNLMFEPELIMIKINFIL